MGGDCAPWLLLCGWLLSSRPSPYPTLFLPEGAHFLRSAISPPTTCQIGLLCLRGWLLVAHCMLTIRCGVRFRMSAGKDGGERRGNVPQVCPEDPVKDRDRAAGSREDGVGYPVRRRESEKDLKARGRQKGGLLLELNLEGWAHHTEGCRRTTPRGSSSPSPLLEHTRPRYV